jgi:Acetyltransferase (GNAT) domain
LVSNALYLFYYGSVELEFKAVCFGMTGYLHSLYAKSLTEFGTPVELPQCGGWLLERRVPNSDLKDAMGCYPLFCCTDWTRLAADIEKIKDRYVTISLVVDPFAPVTIVDLSRYFQLVQPFKRHFIIDVTDSADRPIDRHHRYYARRALRQIQIRLVDDPSACLDDWVRLYQILVERHHLRGIKAFSKTAFATQFKVPGLVIFLASRNGRTIGMHLWYLQSGVAYSHLGASDKEGYSLGAAYALYWSAIQEFKRNHARELRWIDLGAGAGVEGGGRDGLSMFKRGWATGEKVKYFCGSVCNWEIYRWLAGTDQIDSGYFPLYRTGESA